MAQQKRRIAQEHFAAAELALSIGGTPGMTIAQSDNYANLAEAHLRAAAFARSWDEMLGGLLRPEEATDGS